MEAFAKWFEKAKIGIYNTYANDPAKLVVNTGAIAWVLSALSQVGAIMINKDISTDQKKFLIPQELSDNAINIASFYLLTTTMKNIAGKLVSTGKLASKSLRRVIDKTVPKDKIGKYTTDLIKDKFIIEDSRIDTKVYRPFKNGVTMIAATIGSVFAGNIMTPILRNNFGARQQKKSLAKAGLTPVTLSTMNRVSIEDYKQKSVAKPVITSSVGSMKV